MKNLITIILLLSLSSTQAQNVNDYKYVIVPQKFADFEKNDFKLTPKLKMYLRKKNYVIIAEGVTEKPIDLKNNPCLATKADIKQLKSAFKNKLNVIFTDCNQQIIDSFEGVSKIKDFEEGYGEALQLATAQIKNQNAKVKIEENIVKEIPVITNDNNTTNIYIANGVKYQVATTSNGAFLLINMEDQKVAAKFYPSSLPNVYHVEVISDEENYETIGYSKDNSIIIETKTGDKSWVTTTYTK